MQVTQGRTVIFYGPNLYNGTPEHPAIVTRSWSDIDVAEQPARVNLTVLPDCNAPFCQGSVLMFDTRDQAMKYLAENPIEKMAAFFPDRVPLPVVSIPDAA